MALHSRFHLSCSVGSSPRWHTPIRRLGPYFNSDSGWNNHKYFALDQILAGKVHLQVWFSVLRSDHNRVYDYRSSFTLRRDRILTWKDQGAFGKPTVRSFCLVLYHTCNQLFLHIQMGHGKRQKVQHPCQSLDDHTTKAAFSFEKRWEWEHRFQPWLRCQQTFRHFNQWVKASESNIRTYNAEPGKAETKTDLNHQ